MRRIALILCLLLCAVSCKAGTPRRYKIEVVKEYSHDTGAYTQGLFFHGGDLYESTGQYGESSMRKVELQTGRVLRKLDFSRKFFAEGSVILGDNLFYGQNFSTMLKKAAKKKSGATIFGYYVKDPKAYGVVEFDHDGTVLSLEEKPENPKSNYAVPGLYFYDETVVEKAKSLKPSKRGEYEITDLNKLYLKEGTLHVELFGRGFAWLDTGNCDSLLEASNFVETIQKRQGYYIACIEEIAWRNKWVDDKQLGILGEKLSKTQYGQYILSLLDEKL